MAGDIHSPPPPLSEVTRPEVELAEENVYLPTPQSPVQSANRAGQQGPSWPLLRAQSAPAESQTGRALGSPIPQPLT